ncbi:hypothetical protein F4803DRAFT_555144 [Xylaria telfairii]|nr:hypothetical protein F4803DRAFT_555144 [Xylaria telfairii]
MSNDKDNKKSNNDITFPPAAHIRTTRNPSDSVEYPKAANKQDSGKDKSLEWLEDADSFEAPEKDNEGVPNNEKKMKVSDGASGSLDWLVEAANYEPPKQPPKSTKG